MLLETVTGPEDTADQNVDRARAILIALQNTFNGDPMETETPSEYLYYAIDAAQTLLDHAQQGFDAASVERLRAMDAPRNGADKVEALIAAHRAAYDAWVLALKRADVRNPPRWAKKESDAMGEVECRTQEALLAHVPTSLAEASTMLAHIVPHAEEEIISEKSLLAFLKSLAAAGKAAP
jgi:multidrug efflux pump subunit AcrA (membrane-fusion protein)